MHIDSNSEYPWISMIDVASMENCHVTRIDNFFRKKSFKVDGKSFPGKWFPLPTSSKAFYGHFHHGHYIYINLHEHLVPGPRNRWGPWTLEDGNIADTFDMAISASMSLPPKPATWCTYWYIHNTIELLKNISWRIGVFPFGVVALGSFPDSTATGSFQRNSGVSGKDSFTLSVYSLSSILWVAGFHAMSALSSPLWVDWWRKAKSGTCGIASIMKNAGKSRAFQFMQQKTIHFLLNSLHCFRNIRASPPHICVHWPLEFIFPRLSWPYSTNES